MTAAEPPATLKVYRAAIGLCAPLAGLALRLRLSRGKEDEARLCERRGWASLPRPQGEVIWVHGASVGEMLSVLPLIEGILANPRQQDLRVVALLNFMDIAQRLLVPEERLEAAKAFRRSTASMKRLRKLVRGDTFLWRLGPLMPWLENRG